jgi:hypothetical protein
MFEADAIIGAHAHVRVHVESGDVRAPFAHDHCFGILTAASQAQHAAAPAWTGGDQALHGSVGQMVKRQLLFLVFSRELAQVARDLSAHGTRHARNVLVTGCGQRVEQPGAWRLKAGGWRLEE